MKCLNRLSEGDESFEGAWNEICERGLDAEPEVVQKSAEILAAVRERGDEALIELTRRFDEREPSEGTSYELSADRIDAAYADCEPAVRRALEEAAERIRSFHQPQRVEGYRAGPGLSLRALPLRRVGLYVPGGTALYPSSVLMTAIPAKVAGVAEVIMVTPGASRETLAAAKLAGVDRVFEIGGAQAIAALAYGTQSVPRVDKIVGPGNQWVAAAKRLVFGQVDIDSVAGPSEILIIADESARPDWVAADLLAQAEHDTEARPILVTTSKALADAVDRSLVEQLATLSRREIASQSIDNYGTCILVPDLERAVARAEEYAPEHLELCCLRAEEMVPSLRNAGAIFVGHFTPEAAGDYSAGPNHVLPTSGAARYASPLGVYDFVKYTSVLNMSENDLSALKEGIMTLAKVEGLDAHRKSVARRFATGGEET